MEGWRGIGRLVVYLGMGWKMTRSGNQRYLAVDLGTRRIGLALSEPEGQVVSPLCVLSARPRATDNAKAILDVAAEYAADAIVIGLPLNMDGTQGPQARLSLTLAQAVRRAGNLPVHLHDERLTSHAAGHRLADRGLTRKRKKARQDAVAAQILLESFLQTQPDLFTTETQRHTDE